MAAVELANVTIQPEAPHIVFQENNLSLDLYLEELRVKKNSEEGTLI
jgi:hypothetical protein